MQRFADWEERLAAYLEPLRERPFEFGRHDCCTFASGAVQAMTGVDPMAEFRGRYTTSRGAAIALGRIGAGTLEKTMDGKLERVAPGFAQRGDVAMIDGALVIAFGPVAIMVGVVGGHQGLIRREMAEATVAWRVPMVAADG